MSAPVYLDHAATTPLDPMALEVMQSCFLQEYGNPSSVHSWGRGAVVKTAEYLAEQHGFELEFLPVDAFGRVDPDELRARIRKDTAVVSVIYGNNEIGTVNRLPGLGAG